MSLPRVVIALALIGAAAFLSGCGFQPLYAVPKGETQSPLMARVEIVAVKGPDDVSPIVKRALDNQLLAAEAEQHDYDLSVEVEDYAEPLAVQIDATVTRYNYRLRAKYSLLNRKSGGEIKGATDAVASYNIVSSQYSTLFAERSAQEKAAKSLAEAIERDILLQLASAEK